MIPSENLDFMLLQKGVTVYFDDEYKQWVWRQEMPNGNGIVNHGSGKHGYTRAEAYEDAVRGLLGLAFIADEGKL